MKLATHNDLTSMERWEDQRDCLYGPLPINYLTTLRQELNLSHDKFGSPLGLTKHAIIRLEQGTVARIPDCIVDFWSDRGINEHYLEGTYESFRQATRQHYQFLFGEDLEVLTIKGSVHPLKQLRAPNRDVRFGVTSSTPNSSTPVGKSPLSLSIMQVAKMMAIPQSPLQYWETRWRLQKSVPKSFAEALVDMGYKSSAINHFIEQYSQWRENAKRI